MQAKSIKAELSEGSSFPGNMAETAPEPGGSSGRGGGSGGGGGVVVGSTQKPPPSQAAQDRRSIFFRQRVWSCATVTIFLGLAVAFASFAVILLFGVDVPRDGAENINPDVSRWLEFSLLIMFSLLFFGLFIISLLAHAAGKGDAVFRHIINLPVMDMIESASKHNHFNVAVFTMLVTAVFWNQFMRTMRVLPQVEIPFGLTVLPTDVIAPGISCTITPGTARWCVGQQMPFSCTMDVKDSATGLPAAGRVVQALIMSETEERMVLHRGSHVDMSTAAPYNSNVSMCRSKTVYVGADSEGHLDPSSQLMGTSETGSVTFSTLVATAAAHNTRYRLAFRTLSTEDHQDRIQDPFTYLAKSDAIFDFDNDVENVTLDSSVTKVRQLNPGDVILPPLRVQVSIMQNSPCVSGIAFPKEVSLTVWNLTREAGETGGACRGEVGEVWTRLEASGRWITTALQQNVSSLNTSELSFKTDENGTVLLDDLKLASDMPPGDYRITLSCQGVSSNVSVLSGAGSALLQVRLDGDGQLLEELSFQNVCDHPLLDRMADAFGGSTRSFLFFMLLVLLPLLTYNHRRSSYKGTCVKAVMAFCVIISIVAVVAALTVPVTVFFCTEKYSAEERLITVVVSCCLLSFVANMIIMVAAKKESWASEKQVTNDSNLVTFLLKPHPSSSKPHPSKFRGAVRTIVGERSLFAGIEAARLSSAGDAALQSGEVALAGDLEGGNPPKVAEISGPLSIRRQRSDFVNKEQKNPSSCCSSLCKTKLAHMSAESEDHVAYETELAELRAQSFKFPTRLLMALWMSVSLTIMLAVVLYWLSRWMVSEIKLAASDTIVEFDLLHNNLTALLHTAARMNLANNMQLQAERASSQMQPGSEQSTSEPPPVPTFDELTGLRSFQEVFLYKHFRSVVNKANLDSIAEDVERSFLVSITVAVGFIFYSWTLIMKDSRRRILDLRKGKYFDEKMRLRDFGAASRYVGLQVFLCLYGMLVIWFFLGTLVFVSTNNVTSGYMYTSFGATIVGSLSCSLLAFLGIKLLLKASLLKRTKKQHFVIVHRFPYELVDVVQTLLQIMSAPANVIIITAMAISSGIIRMIRADVRGSDKPSPGYLSYSAMISLHHQHRDPTMYVLLRTLMRDTIVNRDLAAAAKDILKHQLKKKLPLHGSKTKLAHALSQRAVEENKKINRHLWFITRHKILHDPAFYQQVLKVAASQRFGRSEKPGPLQPGAEGAGHTIGSMENSALKRAAKKIQQLVRNPRSSVYFHRSHCINNISNIFGSQGADSNTIQEIATKSVTIDHSVEPPRVMWTSTSVEHDVQPVEVVWQTEPSRSTETLRIRAVNPTLGGLVELTDGSTFLNPYRWREFGRCTVEGCQCRCYQGALPYDCRCGHDYALHGNRGGCVERAKRECNQGAYPMVFFLHSLRFWLAFNLHRNPSLRQMRKEKDGIFIDGIVRLRFAPSIPSRWKRYYVRIEVNAEKEPSLTYQEPELSGTQGEHKGSHEAIEMELDKYPNCEELQPGTERGHTDVFKLFRRGTNGSTGVSSPKIYISFIEEDLDDLCEEGEELNLMTLNKINRMKLDQKKMSWLDAITQAQKCMQQLQRKHHAVNHHERHVDIPSTSVRATALFRAEHAASSEVLALARASQGRLRIKYHAKENVVTWFKGKMPAPVFMDEHAAKGATLKVERAPDGCMMLHFCGLLLNVAWLGSSDSLIPPAGAELVVCKVDAKLGGLVELNNGSKFENCSAQHPLSIVSVDPSINGEVKLSDGSCFKNPQIHIRDKPLIIKSCGCDAGDGTLQEEQTLYNCPNHRALFSSGDESMLRVIIASTGSDGVYRLQYTHEQTLVRKDVKLLAGSKPPRFDSEGPLVMLVKTVHAARHVTLDRKVDDTWLNDLCLFENCGEEYVGEEIIEEPLGHDENQTEVESKHVSHQTEVESKDVSDIDELIEDEFDAIELEFGSRKIKGALRDNFEI